MKFKILYLLSEFISKFILVSTVLAELNCVCSCIFVVSKITQTPALPTKDGRICDSWQKQGFH